MHGAILPETIPSGSASELRRGYLWWIAFVAALGGLLFGYDWIVIGGASHFTNHTFRTCVAGAVLICLLFLKPRAVHSSRLKQAKTQRLCSNGTHSE
jgi:hypothetical protein